MSTVTRLLPGVAHAQARGPVTKSHLRSTTFQVTFGSFDYFRNGYIERTGAAELHTHKRQIPKFRVKLDQESGGVRGITRRYEAVVVRVREGNRDVANGFGPLNCGLDTGQVVIPENKL